MSRMQLRFLGTLDGIILFMTLCVLSPISVPLQMVGGGNPGVIFYVVIYCVVVAGVMGEAYLDCQTYIVRGLTSPGRLFKKTMLLFAILYGGGTALGNLLFKFQRSPSVSIEVQALSGFGNVALFAIMVLFGPLIVRFFLVNPLEDAQIAQALSSHKSNIHLAGVKDDEFETVQKAVDKQK